MAPFRTYAFAFNSSTAVPYFNNAATTINEIPVRWNQKTKRSVSLLILAMQERGEVIFVRIELVRTTVIQFGEPAFCIYIPLKENKKNVAL
jgi:hypothetical protein